MRKRTPSEIKAYGNGYAEAYKEFCHLLDRHDKDKAIRKMKIFADAVALTVETATDTADTPQTETQNSNKNSNVISVYDGVSEAVRCAMCSNPNKSDRGCDGACSYDERLYERIMKAIAESVADTPQTETKGVGYCNECKWFRNKQVCGRCRSRNLFCESEVRTRNEDR